MSPVFGSSPPQSPSVYSGYRRQALDFALQKVKASTAAGSEPIYVYGDFNFRLDFSAVVKVCFLDDHTHIQPHSQAVLQWPGDHPSRIFSLKVP